MTDTPPYYAVIFTSIRSEDGIGYEEMAAKMEEMASRQPGYLGFEHAANPRGISISYWRSLGDIAQWKQNSEHQKAQFKGKNSWYDWYKVRICKVEREYEFQKGTQEGA